MLIFSKSSAKARLMEQVIKAREVEKEYLCRVMGEFPAEEVVCDQPLETISFKIGVVVVDPQGKPSKTTFQRVSYKDGVSIVRCLPRSGRMHQIRVHLQYLGFPIANDPLYNSQIFGPEKAKGGLTGKTNEELIEDLIKNHTLENWVESEEYEASRMVMTESRDTTEKDSTEEDKIEEEEREFYDADCRECRTRYKDPPADTLVMFLHALKYSGQGWSYQTDVPSWAHL